MKSVLFVCTGNICRSPTADALLRHEIKKKKLNLYSDSCGIHGYHIGEAPDSRSVKIAAQHGVDMSGLRARKLEPEDFEKFDILVAMDNGHKRDMLQIAPHEYRDKVKLFLDYVDGCHGQDVPDPYYGDLDGFIRCYDLVEAGVDRLLNDLLS